VHFASIGSYFRSGKQERDFLAARAKQHAERAEQLSREQDRLQALSQIGRLALTAAEAQPVRALLEMSHRTQRALGASRCSLIIFPASVQERYWNGHTKDRNVEVRAMAVEHGALRRILHDGKLTELRPGEDKDLMARVKVFFPDSNPFGSVLVAPIEAGGSLRGALFLIDTDHTRNYAEAERDFFWTVALMTGAFVHARAKLENEVQLRTLITNAPVIMFALTPDSTVTLFAGRGTAVLGSRIDDIVGRPLLSLVGNVDETQEAFEQALAGRIATGGMLLRGTLFETQYSPLRGVDGEISGVMGVTTAILDAPAPAPPPRPEAAHALRDSAEHASPAAPPAPAAGATEPPATPADREPPKRRPATPGARPDLKPLIPLRDED
jgi:PAS domain-containing protein